ncbi:uncharacterized protein CLUP02_04922 [Colletotrichum lupini]|uniref:Uncharacterized protein n=1 Tax=Colletotrichum lupini TaxID=145971 RepID=A0A9Q8SN01_9PEZI|nr:uncharacterized protein CLUP02_04922 [Colletotrichum lupini]UQC79442.1 hypothetical protein CLUP02_04922 [Colletotrichum lupini]
MEMVEDPRLRIRTEQRFLKPDSLCHISCIRLDNGADDRTRGRLVRDPWAHEIGLGVVLDYSAPDAGESKPAKERRCSHGGVFILDGLSTGQYKDVIVGLPSRLTFSATHSRPGVKAPCSRVGQVFTPRLPPFRHLAPQLLNYIEA